MTKFLIALVFIAAGMLLLDGAINDRNPIDVGKAIFQGNKLPAKGTFGHKYSATGTGDIPGSKWSPPLNQQPPKAIPPSNNPPTTSGGTLV